jgi:hypothetical protein
MTFTHSGNAGDIIYSIPTIKHLAGSEPSILHIKAAKYVHGNQFEFVNDLLLQQGITEVHPFIPSDGNWNYYNWPGLNYDYDLDDARHQRKRGVIHIVKRYFDQFGIKKDHITPWLKVDEAYKRNDKYALIHLTPRWNGLQYDWRRIYKEALQRHGKVYFIGFEMEWLDFSMRYGAIEHIATETLLDITRLIRDAEALYCNQGVCLTVAQGLGKEYWLVKNGDKTNCHIGTNNEHLIGFDYLIPDHTLGAVTKPDSHINYIMGNK